MQTHPYFQILGKLTREKIPYCVMGLMGASFHGSTLTTYDLDLFIKPKAEVIASVRKILRAFGLAEVAVQKEQILKPPPTDQEILKKKIVLLFADAHGLSIDIMTRVSGLQFPTVWKARKTFSISGQKVYVASLKHIITSKLIAGREKDLLHVKRLKEILNIQKGLTLNPKLAREPRRKILSQIGLKKT